MVCQWIAGVVVWAKKMAAAGERIGTREVMASGRPAARDPQVTELCWQQKHEPWPRPP